MERLGAEFRDTFREVEASLKSIGEGFHPLLPAVEPLLNLAVMPKTAGLERVRTAFVLGIMTMSHMSRVQEDA